MKKLLLVAILMLSCLTQAQDYSVNHESPTGVVKAIFYAAKSGEFNVFGGLCDPLGEGDGDVKQICQLGFPLNEAQKEKLAARGKTEEELKEEVKQVFENGEISGTTRYETTENGNFAYVDFYFYPNGTEKRMETMKLVQRGEEWYLYSF